MTCSHLQYLWPSSCDRCIRNDVFVKMDLRYHFCNDVVCSDTPHSHLLTFSNHFVLIRFAVNLKRILGTLGVWWDYSHTHDSHMILMILLLQ